MISNQYTDQNQLYIALGYCAFMLLLGWLLKKFPPKKINHLYGYRTQRSMKNQATWEAANTYSSLVFFKISLYSFLIFFQFHSGLLLLKLKSSDKLFVVKKLEEIRLLFQDNFDSKKISHHSLHIFFFHY